MNQKFRITYFLSVFFCCALILFENFSLSNYFRVGLISMLYINFLYTRPNASLKIILPLGVATLCSIIPFLFYENITKNIESCSYLMFIIAHLCYAFIFKTENASIFTNKKITWSIVAMIWVGFLFLMAINNDLRDGVFFTLLVATFVKIIMVWLAFSRKVSEESNTKGKLAMMMFIFSDVAFMVEYWTNFTFFIAFVNLFYTLGQFYLFESFAQNTLESSDSHSKFSQQKNVLNS